EPKDKIAGDTDGAKASEALLRDSEPKPEAKQADVADAAGDNAGDLNFKVAPPPAGAKDGLTVADAESAPAKDKDKGEEASDAGANPVLKGEVTKTEGAQDGGDQGKDKVVTPGDGSDKGPEVKEAAEVKDKTTLTEVIEDAMNVQEKVKKLGFHMDKFGERLREVNVGDPNPEERGRRMNEALKQFEEAAVIVKPEDVLKYRNDRRIVKEAIEQEEKKAESERDLEKLKALKIVERNLYVLERAPGLTHGNAALALYGAGEVQPIETPPFNGRSRAQAMLEFAYINDPVLRYGKDSNFFNRAREIERRHDVPIQEQGLEISLRLQEIELRGLGSKINMVPAAPELLGGRPPIETKADDNAGDGNDKLVDPAASAEGAKDGAVTGDPQKDVPVVGNDGQDGDKPVIDPTKVKPITADMSGEGDRQGDDRRPALPAALQPGATVERNQDAKKVEVADAALSRISGADPKLEVPELSDSPMRKSALLKPEYRELSPKERAEVALRIYEMYKERGATPRQALTADVIAEFEKSIQDADAGVTPKSKELEAQVKQATENIATFGGTALKDIVWNPQAEDDAGKKALPEALKGREEISWQDARSQLNEKFDGFLGNKDLPLTDDQKRATVQYLMNLNQAVTPGEYNDVVDQMKQDASIKDLIANPGFIALMEEHKTLAQPLISLTGQRAAVVEEYRNEVNQRAVTRMLYANVLKEVADDESGAADRTQLVESAKKYFTEGFANNVDSEKSNNFIAWASDFSGGQKSNVQVKPAELFQAALDKQKQFAAGEANMAMPMAVLADASTRLFELETYNLAKDSSNITQEEKRQAFENLKPLFDRMVTDADASPKSTEMDKFETRYRYGEVLLGGVGDEAGKVESGRLFKEAFTHATDGEKGQAALELAIRAGVSPVEMLKLSVDGNSNLKEGESFRGVPLPVAARNAKLLYEMQVKQLAADKDNPTDAERARALEMMRPDLERMVTVADSMVTPQDDEKASTRIALGSILLENKDEKAKVVLSEAYSLGASSGLLQVAGDLAVAAGAKPSDLIGGLLEQSSKESIPPAQLDFELKRMMEKHLQESKGMVDGKPATESESQAAALKEFEPHMAKLATILDANVASANENLTSWNTKVESHFPEDATARQAALDIHNKLFRGENREANIQAAAVLLAGGDRTGVNPDFLKDFDEWQKHVAPEGKKDAALELLQLEASKPIEEAKVEQAVALKYNYSNYRAGLHAVAGDREKANEIFAAGEKEVPEQFRQKLVDDSPEVARMRELITGEIAPPNLKDMTPEELTEHINQLSLKPVLRIKLKGHDQTFEVDSLDDLYKQKLDGKLITQADVEHVQQGWGPFDAEKAKKNIAEYKLAYEELIRRADNPVTQTGDAITMEDTKKEIDLLNRGLAEGKDVITEGEPALSNERRLEYHLLVTKGLKLLTDPVSIRMEYAMRMEALGQRASAGMAYMEAQNLLNDYPTQLIEKERESLRSEKVRFAGSPGVGLNLNGSHVEADMILARLTQMVEGNQNYGDAVLDRDLGLNGESVFIDPRKIGAPDLSSIYGMDDMKSALAKRAAFFFLAPKFEQAEELGKPMFVYTSKDYPQDGSKPQVMEKGALVQYVAQKEGISTADAANLIRPHGNWTFGNSDAFKPDQAMDSLAQAIKDQEGVSIEEARTRVQAHAADAVKFLVGAEKMNTDAIRQSVKDPEFAMIYQNALNNLEPSLANTIRQEAGGNFWADAATTTAFMASMAGLSMLISRGKVNPAVGRLTTGQVLRRSAGIFLASTAVAAGTRVGVRYLQTGEVEAPSDTFWHTMGSVGVGLIGHKLISSKVPNEAMRLIPSSYSRRIAYHSIKAAPEIAQPMVRSTFRFLSNVGKPMTVYESSKWLENNLGPQGQQGTVGHLFSLMDEAGQGARTAQFIRGVGLVDDTGKAVLREANLSTFGSSKFLQEAAASGNTINTLGDLRTFLSGKGLKAELSALDDAMKAAKLSADDLAKPISSNLGQNILKETNLYGANLRGVAREIHTNLVKGQTTDMARLVDEMSPILEADRAALHVDKAADIFNDALKVSKSTRTPATMGDLKSYLETLGPQGRAAASRIPELVDDLARPIVSAEGKAVIRELGLYGQNMGRIAQEAQGAVLDRTAQTLARGAGGSAEEVSIQQLQKSLADRGLYGPAMELESAAKRLKVDTAAKLSSTEAQAVLQRAGLNRTPNMLTSVDDAVSEFTKTLGDGATLGDLKAALAAKNHKLATELSKKIPAAQEGLKLTDDAAKQFLRENQINFYPGILGREELQFTAAELSDNFVKVFGDDAASFTLKDFKEYYGRNFADKFDDAFPNLKDVPEGTLLADVLKQHVRAFDGSGLYNVLGKMDEEAVKAIRGAETAGVVKRTGTLINNGGRTAWSSLKDAYTAVRTDPGAAMASAQEKVASVARAATTGETYSSAMRSFMEKMPTVQGAIDSAKSGGYNLAVGGKDRVVGSYKWASDTVGFHTMDAGTDLLTMARSGNANALHTYLAMKGWYNMTAGAHELRMQVNKETGENYTAIESLTTALTPDLVGENMSQTAWKSLMTAGELAFMVQLLRTGNLGKPVLGPNGLPAPSGYNPLNYLNATRRMAGVGFDTSLTRGWSLMKEAGMESSLSGTVFRSVGTGGAMLGGNQFFDGAVSVPYNWIQHHEPFKTDMQIGPWSREKYNMMRTDISN
ncbi:MAG: hypothetical protein R3F51_28545, partial [Cyanobacteriota/Melainabacteria group bacterium]